MSSPSLEESLRQLEQIVQSLESGKLPLEEGIKKFEEGILLYKNNKKILDNAEHKIKVLTESLKEEDLSR